jgi:hypothetical protein
MLAPLKVVVAIPPPAEQYDRALALVDSSDESRVARLRLTTTKN